MFNIIIIIVYTLIHPQCSLTLHCITQVSQRSDWLWAQGRIWRIKRGEMSSRRIAGGLLIECNGAKGDISKEMGTIAKVLESGNWDTETRPIKQKTEQKRSNITIQIQRFWNGSV